MLKEHLQQQLFTDFNQIKLIIYSHLFIIYALLLIN